MEIGSKIHNKLITDFQALKFSDNTVIFQNVRKFFPVNSMKSLDCLIVPGPAPEVVEGQSAGNFQTTRMYNFRAVVMEVLESTTTNVEGDIKYTRIMNILDAILDYLQKEPSNLNAWGNSNSINIFKIRVGLPDFVPQQSTNGYSVILDVPFIVYLNVVPQNL